MYSEPSRKRDRWQQNSNNDIGRGLRDSVSALRWRHNWLDSVSSHQPHDCLLNRSFGRRSKKASKPRVTGLCVGNSPVTGEFPAQMASNAENVSIWWRHHSEKCKDMKVGVVSPWFYFTLSCYVLFFTHWSCYHSILVQGRLIDQAAHVIRIFR